MQAILYINESDNNRINKTLREVARVNIILKDDTNNITPTIIISRATTIDFNYIYIADFNRYYFVTSSAYSQQKYIVNLSVDVLRTYKNDIYNLNVIANRSSSRFNLYQTDAEISFLNKNDIITMPFPGGFSGLSMILAVNGGNQSNNS